jgi:CRISPR-associated protein Cmr2
MNYGALTIGPIYEVILDTLHEKNKTKRLKAGSYFFSFFMKNFADELKKNNIEILVPFSDIKDEEIKKMGIYHDRLIAVGKEDLREYFLEAYDKAFEKVAKEYGLDVEGLKKDMTNHYFFADEKELKEINENVIFAINSVLDSLEQNRVMEFDRRFDEIKKFQRMIVEGKKEEFRKVKTLEEISGKVNYYAVVFADGDSMGEKIKKIATKDPKKIKFLSEKLYDFFVNLKLDEMVEQKFNGELIFAGGDDILAFLPLINDKNTIFEFVETLHKSFKEKVGEDVSLSFGISVVYVKHPLKKAIEDSKNFLDEAKKFRKNKNTKNGALAIQIIKHSGHKFKSFHIVDTKEYNKFKKFVKRAIFNEEKMPKGFQYKVNEYKKVIINLYEKDKSIIPFFENIFNEHSEEVLEEIKEIGEYFDMYKPKVEEEFDKLINDFHIVKFIRDRNETVEN